MKYILSNVEQKTASTGTQYKSATFTAEDGASFDKVGVFADSPIYAEVVDGATVEGDIKQNAKGYNNFYPHRANAPAGKFGGGMGKALMEEKKQGIRESQDRKDESIKTSSTFRDATLIALEWYRRNPTAPEIEFNRKWVEVRKWLLEHYDLDSSDVPF